MLESATLLLLLIGGAHPAEDEAETVITRRGHVVCLDQDLRALADEALCNEPGATRFALETAAGERLYLLPDDPRAEMFIDPEVRMKELVLEGWPRPEGHLELLHVYSIKDGRLHHLHYRCDLCNITATAPGPCWCCRQPFELREVAVGGEGAALPSPAATGPGGTTSPR